MCTRQASRNSSQFSLRKSHKRILCLMSSSIEDQLNPDARSVFAFCYTVSHNSRWLQSLHSFCFAFDASRLSSIDCVLPCSLFIYEMYFQLYKVNKSPRPDDHEWSAPLALWQALSQEKRGRKVSCLATATCAVSTESFLEIVQSLLQRCIHFSLLMKYLAEAIGIIEHSICSLIYLQDWWKLNASNSP